MAQELLSFRAGVECEDEASADRPCPSSNRSSVSTSWPPSPPPSPGIARGFDAVTSAVLPTPSKLCRRSARRLSVPALSGSRLDAAEESVGRASPFRSWRSWMAWSLTRLSTGSGLGTTRERSRRAGSDVGSLVSAPRSSVSGLSSRHPLPAAFWDGLRGEEPRGSRGSGLKGAERSREIAEQSRPT
jgi:hypothetical protein